MRCYWCKKRQISFKQSSWPYCQVCWLALRYGEYKPPQFIPDGKTIHEAICKVEFQYSGMVEDNLYESDRWLD